MRNKGLVTLLVIYFILFIADLISTLIINSELIRYLEANPLFKYGGLPIIILANLFIIFGSYYAYSRTSVNWRYIIIIVLLTTCFARVIVIPNNIEVYKENDTPVKVEQTIQQIQQIPEQELQEIKTDALLKLIIPTFQPFLFAFISWFFFKQDHEVERK